MKFWLIVEKAENWQIDKENGFEFFGLPEKSRKFAKGLEPGDVLLTYVSGVPSAIADSRRVIEVDCPAEDRLALYRSSTAYLRDLSFLLLTKPMDVLQREQWIPFKTLTDQLSATKGRKTWNWFVQTSLRQLTDADGAMICSAIEDVILDD